LKVLFDTNIILDVLLDRELFIDLSASLVSLVETNVIEGYLCATTVTTIDYLVSKAYNRDQANIAIKKLLNIFQVAEVNKDVLRLSTDSKFADFEDAVLHYSGQLVSVDSIVTRNIIDFKRAEYPVYSPIELWGIIKTSTSSR
jgi:predicted nucleic acid-binding protein